MSKRNWTSLCFVLYAVFELASSQRGNLYPPQYSDLPPGPYCEEKGCCLGRKDECSAPILGTLCYCDDFCNATRVDDCCPDYWTHCKGYVIPTTIRPPQEKKTCTLNGRYYGFGDSVKTNCNVCKCEVVNDDLDMLCERDECLIETSTIDAVNRDRNLGWTASNHTEFWGRKLSDGIQLRLGTLLPESFVMQMNPIMTFYDPNKLPTEFNAEKQWPSLISGVQEQGWCASSWAISTAAVASDRFGIVSGGTENVRLSAQHLLSCDPTGKQGCQGGQLDRAWATIRRYGLVDENCFPYVGYSVKCPFAQYTSDLLSAGCQVPPNGLRTSKYRVGAAYRLGNETDIMYEILNSGPVQATMLVNKDFFTYQNGIYKHTGVSQSSQTGYLSVRIVGWGEEYNYNGYQKYWKVANSWGQDWGENGYFRIARGTDESEIESFVIAAWPTVTKKIYNNRFG